MKQMEHVEAYERFDTFEAAREHAVKLAAQRAGYASVLKDRRADKFIAAPDNCPLTRHESLVDWVDWRGKWPRSP